jgi:hypothetical protein
MDVDHDQSVENKNKSEVVKKKLREQLEFYFSDENLINDKFLKKYMMVDNVIDANVLLKFNKIRSILAGFSDDQAILAIKSALKHSKILKMKNKNISRRVKFDCDDIVLNEINNRTIYVENLPPDATHDQVKQVFERCGSIKHISIPKTEGKKKGFGFITYNTSQESEAAIKEFNNTVPAKFLSWHSKHELKGLVVISKEDWAIKKDEFKKLKKELQMENKELFVGCLSQDNSTVNTLTPGTLVRITNIPDSILDKYAIKTWVSHYVEPAFVDLNKTKKECVLRFSYPIQAEVFLKKLDNPEFNQYNIAGIKISNEEETEYFNKVNELKNKLKEKKILIPK